MNRVCRSLTQGRRTNNHAYRKSPHGRREGKSGTDTGRARGYPRGERDPDAARHGGNHARGCGQRRTGHPRGHALAPDAGRLRWRGLSPAGEPAALQGAGPGRTASDLVLRRPADRAEERGRGRRDERSQAGGRLTAGGPALVVVGELAEEVAERALTARRGDHKVDLVQVD